MINIFDNYLRNSIDLELSLKQAGYTHDTVILNDDGFLPDDLLSPIKFFISSGKGGSDDRETPKFFNELDLPKEWEIRGDGQKAEIFEGYKKRGCINYSQRPQDYRIIKSVDWLNDQEKLRATDMYNKYGCFFGRKTYSDGELVLTSYLNDKQKEILLINHITGTIQVNYNSQNFVFENYNEFLNFYFECAEIDTSHIIYNSLGRPFFITLYLKYKNPHKRYNHTLFWQEKSAEIPGNMVQIIKDTNTPTKKIIVQDREEYLRLKQQNVSAKVSMQYLGMLYNFSDKERVNKNIFIYTNSDNIENLEELVNLLPNYKFRIAARTEMSSKLMAFNSFSNVSLYPSVTSKEVEKLISKSSLYFDINKGNEVENIIRTVFENNLLIFSFLNTVHNSQFIDSNNIFNNEETHLMINKVKVSTKNIQSYRKAIGGQKWAAGQSTIDEYKEILK